MRAILVELALIDGTCAHRLDPAANIVHAVDNTLVESAVAPSFPTYAFISANGVGTVNTALLGALFHSVAKKSVRANGIIFEEPAVSLGSTHGRQTRVPRHTIIVVRYEFALEASVTEVITASKGPWAETLILACITLVFVLIAKAGPADGTIEAAAVDASTRQTPFGVRSWIQRVTRLTSRAKQQIVTEIIVVDVQALSSVEDAQIRSAIEFVAAILAWSRLAHTPPALVSLCARCSVFARLTVLLKLEETLPSRRIATIDLTGLRRAPQTIIIDLAAVLKTLEEACILSRALRRRRITSVLCAYASEGRNGL